MYEEINDAVLPRRKHLCTDGSFCERLSLGGSYKLWPIRVFVVFEFSFFFGPLGPLQDREG